MLAPCRRRLLGARAPARTTLLTRLAGSVSRPRSIACDIRSTLVADGAAPGVDSHVRSANARMPRRSCATFTRSTSDKATKSCLRPPVRGRSRRPLQSGSTTRRRRTTSGFGSA